MKDTVLWCRGAGGAEAGAFLSVGKGDHSGGIVGEGLLLAHDVKREGAAADGQVDHRGNRHHAGVDVAGVNLHAILGGGDVADEIKA